ncbi:Ankyrin repeat domain-containing protein 7 [Lemmus lemmus]
MHGADPHIPDFNGNAALHHAVCRGNTTIAGRLLEYNVNIDAKTKYGLTPYKLALFERQQEMAEFLIRNGAHSELTPISGTTAAEASEQTMKESGSLNKEENFSTDSVPSCSHSAVRPPRKTKIIFKMSFLTNRASQRHKDQITLSEDTMAREPEQRKEKHVTFNTEVHYNTDKKPFCSGIRTPGEPKSILKKSIPINGDNTRNNDQLSLRLSINPDVPTSSTEDKASTSAIKEDTESTSSRYRSTQKQFFYYKMIAEKQKRDQEAFWKSVMDPRSLGEAMPEFGGKISCLMVENKREGFLPARHEHDIVPQPPAHADSTSSCHASDRGDNHQASEETSAHSATLEHTCSLGTYTGYARGRPHADPEPAPSSHTGDTMDPVQHSDPVLETGLEENTVW